MAIRLLPPEVSSKIAAGEVIERPASVVKELVENSLDAGATRVTVEIRGGGVDYIRVADDGCGISSGEVELAFQRFATSKLADVEGLDAISTLGFRGEALPSICAVARVLLVTRSVGEETGTCLEVEEGKVLHRAPQGAAVGTAITVQDLFRNLPARRNFLRSTATETSRIQTLVTRYALAYSHVRFQLVLESASVFSSPGSGDLREALSAVYGVDVAQAMLELSGEPGDREGPGPVVMGMISPPSLDRANRSYISFFVNSRWVQNRILGYALQQAYHGFLKERRFPMAAVQITLPHEDVDVNVHPAKSEVRFRRENQVFGALQQTVRHTLTSFSPVPHVQRSTAALPAPAALPRSSFFSPLGWPVGPPAPASPGRPGSLPSLQPLYPEPLAPKKALPALRVLGQVQNTYIAAEGPDGMYLVDQHASHERVVFEQVRAGVSSRTSQVQSLLEPAVVELNARQQELVEAQGELLAGIGFALEPFGSNTYLLRGVPSLLGGLDPGRAFIDTLDAIAEGGGFESWEERAAYSVACHGAIRAGKALSMQEMSELTRQLEECQQPHTCPHGRPTMIHLSSGHLEREFGRR